MGRDDIRTGRRSMTVVGLLILGSVLLGADCGGSPPANTASAQPAPAQQSAPEVAKPPSATAPAASESMKACALLTKEEVGAALGKPVVPMAETTAGEAASCEYHDATHQPNKFVAVLVYTLTPASAKGTFEGMRGVGGEKVAVQGIGDDAYWDGRSSLSVLKGRYHLDISVTEPDVDGLKVARTLAPKVLSRLP